MQKIIILATIIPNIVFAADGRHSIEGIFTNIAEIITKLFPIVVFLALIVFMFGIVRMLMGTDKGTTKKIELNENMVWGIIGLMVIISVWGLVSLVANSLDITLGGKF